MPQAMQTAVVVEFKKPWWFGTLTSRDRIGSRCRGRCHTRDGRRPRRRAMTLLRVDIHQGAVCQVVCSSSFNGARAQTPPLQAARARMLVDGVDAAPAAFEVGYEGAS